MTCLGVFLLKIKPSAVSIFESIGKSSVSISYKTKECYGEALCVEKVVVKELSGRDLTVIELHTGWGEDVQPSLQVSVNGESLPDPVRKPFHSDNFFVKQVSSLFVSVQGFGYRVLLDKNGRFYIYLDPFFANKVCSLSRINCS